MGENIKIKVFKLNWIAQRDLEFEVHKEHTGKKKEQTIVDKRVKAVGSGYVDTPTKT